MIKKPPTPSKPLRLGDIRRMEAAKAAARAARKSAPPGAPAKPQSAPLTLPPGTRVSVLVPYRSDGGGARDRNWAYLRSLYETRYPLWEIVTAEGPEGEFSRAGAICDASERASGDVFLVVDADVWCDGLEDAAARVAGGAAWADPAAPVVVRMTEAATQAAIDGAPLSQKGAPDPLRRVACGGAVAISRACFLRCPPDRRFVGWGCEDKAWAAELERMYGPAARGIGATLWHLWHPPVANREPSRATRRLMEAHIQGTAGALPTSAEPKLPAGAVVVLPPAAPPSPATPAPATSAEPKLTTGLRPRVPILADVPTWAWARKGQALVRHLSDRFDCQMLYSSQHDAGPVIAGRKYDLLHTFEVFQASGLPQKPPVRHVTGITAHVWRTWEKRHGAGTVKRWCGNAVGVHANSKLLQAEFAAYLGRPVFYVPNGVDEEFFRRTRPRSSRKLVVGYVGKPNPRKGYEIIAEACKKVGVELRDVQRRSGDALSAEDMREWYQDIHALVVASDMDGTPNPALEAAACECAIVSNPIGNMPEFITHGVNGLVHDRTVNGLAAALRDLAGRSIEEVEEMGQAARRTVEAEWTWRQMAENYGAMWAACVQERSK